MAVTLLMKHQLLVINRFGTNINKDVVRHMLEKHYRPAHGGNGPSWLTILGHMKDSIWSIDLYRCESIVLRAHWVSVVMDQYTRRIIGFGVHTGVVDGEYLPPGRTEKDNKQNLWVIYCVHFLVS